MDSICTELALYGTKNECARTDNVFSPISEVCNGTVSLKRYHVLFPLILFQQGVVSFFLSGRLNYPMSKPDYCALFRQWYWFLKRGLILVLAFVPEKVEGWKLTSLFGTVLHAGIYMELQPWKLESIWSWSLASWDLYGAQEFGPHPPPPSLFRMLIKNICLKAS